MIEIKPCPFCGSTNLRVMGGIGKYVKCRDCEASSGHLPGGSCSADEGAAVEAWNARWERTCHDSYDGREFGCSECGAVAHLLIRDEAGEWQRAMPDRCPACGAKVVER